MVDLVITPVKPDPNPEKRLRPSSTKVSEIKNKNAKYGACALVACTVLMASPLALAGPPFMTDDPETVEYQHHEFYIATQQIKTKDGRSGALPLFEYNYGAGPNLQLLIIVPFASRPEKSPDGSFRIS